MNEYFRFGDLSITIRDYNGGVEWKVKIEDDAAASRIVFEGISTYLEALKIAKRFCKSKIDVWNGLLKQIEEETKE